MSILLITYDLRAPNRDYKTLFATIAILGDHARIAESVWAVATQLSPIAVRDTLWKVMDANDLLFVVQIDPQSSAWANIQPVAPAWLKKW